MALLAGAAVVQGLGTLVHVCKTHHSVPAWEPVHHPTRQDSFTWKDTGQVPLT